ncbi:MAG: translation initiation factor IF-2 [Desulfovibrio sp.]|nr:translation initiation factor IF-2 [Desulfovibrio sp.]
MCASSPSSGAAPRAVNRGRPLRAVAARACLLIAAGLLCCALAHLPAGPAQARSAMSPRHSGMEPPGGPRTSDVMPGGGPTRTAEGGMGYTDAYGNTLDDVPPPEKEPRKRPRAGAYGGYGAAPQERPLPDPGAASDAPPVWSFK